MRISDWSSDVCSSDLNRGRNCAQKHPLHSCCARRNRRAMPSTNGRTRYGRTCTSPGPNRLRVAAGSRYRLRIRAKGENGACGRSLSHSRSEEHTSELQSLMRISYAVFCLKKKKLKIDNDQL